MRLAILNKGKGIELSNIISIPFRKYFWAAIFPRGLKKPHFSEGDFKVFLMS